MAAAPLLGLYGNDIKDGKQHELQNIMIKRLQL